MPACGVEVLKAHVVGHGIAPEPRELDAFRHIWAGEVPAGLRVGLVVPSPCWVVEQAVEPVHLLALCRHRGHDRCWRHRSCGNCCRCRSGRRRRCLRQRHAGTHAVLVLLQDVVPHTLWVLHTCRCHVCYHPPNPGQLRHTLRSGHTVHKHLIRLEAGCAPVPDLAPARVVAFGILFAPVRELLGVGVGTDDVVPVAVVTPLVGARLRTSLTHLPGHRVLPDVVGRAIVVPAPRRHPRHIPVHMCHPRLILTPVRGCRHVEWLRQHLPLGVDLSQHVALRVEGVLLHLTPAKEEAVAAVRLPTTEHSEAHRLRDHAVGKCNPLHVHTLAVGCEAAEPELHLLLT